MGVEDLPRTSGPHKRKVVHQPLPEPTLSSSYVLGVKVCVNKNLTRVFTFYKPPQNRLAIADVHTLLNFALPTIVTGDFNAKHTARNSNTISFDRCRLLDDAMLWGYEVLGPETSTHFPHISSHIPDVMAITRGLTATPSLDVLDDHSGTGPPTSSLDSIRRTHYSGVAFPSLTARLESLCHHFSTICPFQADHSTRRRGQSRPRTWCRCHRGA